MKIAFVYPYFHPMTGGVENTIRHLADELQKHHDVAVFTSERSPKTTLAYPVQQIPTWMLGRYPLPRKRRMRKIRQFEPDVIHFHGPHPFTTATAFYTRKLNARRILTYHAHVNPRNPLLKFIAFLERQFYRFLFDHIIVTTQKYKRQVEKFFPKDRISVVPPGIHDDFQTSRLEPLKKFLHRKPNILFVGALDTNHRYKGVHTLLKCAALTPEYQYTIIGDGNLRQKYMEEAKDLPNVRFLGYVPDKKLPHHYQSANLFVLPSTSSSEGFGMVLLEAMACGTPTVTTSRVGSADLLLDHKASHLVKADSTHALKEGITTVLSDKDLRLALINNGTKMARSMTWPHVTSKTLKIYAMK